MRAGMLAVASLALTLLAHVASVQDDAIFRFTIDGGGDCVGDVLELSGTIGQPDAGPPTPMTGGDSELTGGFWPGMASPPEEGRTGSNEKLKKAKFQDRNGENQLKVTAHRRFCNGVIGCTDGSSDSTPGRSPVRRRRTSPCVRRGAEGPLRRDADLRQEPATVERAAAVP